MSRSALVLLSVALAMHGALGMAPAPMPETVTASSIADLVMGRSEFSILAAVVERANLTELLADPTLMATAFLPDNEAVQATLAALNISAAEFASNTPDELATALSYHIVPGEALTTGQLTDGMILQSMLEGPMGELLVNKPSVYGWPSLETTGGQPDVQIKYANWMAGAAVVHVVSEVLLYGNMTLSAMPPATGR